MNLLRQQALYVGIFLAAVFAVAVGAEAGQDRGGPPRGPDVERLAAELDLDADQQSRLEAIFDDTRSQLMALRDDVRASGGPPDATTRAEAERIREETDARVAEVLDTTPEEISCVLNLTGLELGYWDVVVQNPDGQQGILAEGFHVLPPITWSDAERLTSTPSTSGLPSI